MDAKDLRIEPALSERTSDGSKYAQSGTALQCNKNKSYQGIGSNPSAKVDAPSARPCAIIGPDRVIPPTEPNDAYIKKAQVEPWPCPESLYHRPPEYLHKAATYHNPTRNISPRQTFQENMQRIMVPPTYNSVKVNEDASFIHKLSVTPDAKYCDVPYSFNSTTNDSKNMRSVEMCLPNVNPALGRPPNGWAPSAINIRPQRPYVSSDMYQYPDYPSCAGPRPISISRQPRTIPEESGYIYPEHYYQEPNIRFKPYPNVKERYPQPRYDYVTNYSNPFHPPPCPPQKYEISKPLPPHPYSGHPHFKYIDSRMPDSILEGYQRPVGQQGTYNIAYRNQIMHPAYGPMMSNNSQSKMPPYPPDGSFKAVSSNKLPFDSNGKIYVEYDNARTKPLPPSESFYSNEISRQHSTKNALPNYPINAYSLPPHSYYKKEHPQIKNYDYINHLKNLNPAINMNSPMQRLIPHFSPNGVAISPTDSNTSNDTLQTHGTSQEDCGYVSQSSTTSVRSIDFGNSRIPNDYYGGYYDPRYGPVIRATPTLSKTNRNNNSGSTDNKAKKDMDVRKFLQMWNEGDDDNADISSSKEVLAQNNSNELSNTTKPHGAMNSQEQLYVLGLVHVPSEDLSKYEHIQKVSKLPENIKGYNSLELLNQFEEVIESSNMNGFKLPTSKEFPTSTKQCLHKQSIAMLPRPISPLDVEAKISQSVIHKEVGCNFEIKPCSPKMLNVEIATPAQNIINERVIDKVTNPLSMISTPILNVIDNIEHCNIPETRQSQRMLEDSEEISSCKMIKTQFSNPNTHSIKTNYSIQDLESNAGVCLASLPRLDNDIELNFPEVNQQFINANKGDPEPSTQMKDLPKLSESDQSNKILSNVESESFATSELSPKIETEREFTKLSKYRKMKTNISDGRLGKPASKVIRTDSVIIKNPENIKTLDMDDEQYATNQIDQQNFPDLMSPVDFVVDKSSSTNALNEAKVKNISHIALDMAVDFRLHKDADRNFELNHNTTKTYESIQLSKGEELLRKCDFYENQDKALNYCEINKVDMFSKETNSDNSYTEKDTTIIVSSNLNIDSFVSSSESKNLGVPSNVNKLNESFGLPSSHNENTKSISDNEILEEQLPTGNVDKTIVETFNNSDKEILTQLQVDRNISSPNDIEIKNEIDKSADCDMSYGQCKVIKPAEYVKVLDAADTPESELPLSKSDRDISRPNDIEIINEIDKSKACDMLYGQCKIIKPTEDVKVLDTAKISQIELPFSKGDRNLSSPNDIEFKNEIDKSAACDLSYGQCKIIKPTVDVKVLDSAETPESELPLSEGDRNISSPNDIEIKNEIHKSVACDMSYGQCKIIKPTEDVKVLYNAETPESELPFSEGDRNISSLNDIEIKNEIQKYATCDISYGQCKIIKPTITEDVMVFDTGKSPESELPFCKGDRDISNPTDIEIKNEIDKTATCNMSYGQYKIIKLTEDVKVLDIAETPESELPFSKGDCNISGPNDIEIKNEIHKAAACDVSYGQRTVIKPTEDVNVLDTAKTLESELPFSKGEIIKDVGQILQKESTNLSPTTPLNEKQIDSIDFQKQLIKLEETYMTKHTENVNVCVFKQKNEITHMSNIEEGFINIHEKQKCCKDTNSNNDVDNDVHCKNTINIEPIKYFCKGFGYGSKELYSPWIQKLIMFDEGFCCTLSSHKSKLSDQMEVDNLLMISRLNDIDSTTCSNNVSDRITEMSESTICKSIYNNTYSDITLQPENVLQIEVNSSLSATYCEQLNKQNKKYDEIIDIQDHLSSNIRSDDNEKDKIIEKVLLCEQGENTSNTTCETVISETKAKVYSYYELDINKQSTDTINEHSIEKYKNTMKVIPSLSTTNHRLSLKRSFSDSALNTLYSGSLPDQGDLSTVWPIKRSKVVDTVDQSKIIAQNVCNILQHNRRNSVSTMYNDNVSFCILIEDNSMLTEENDGTEKLCYTELSEDCLNEIQNPYTCEENNMDMTSENVTCNEETNYEYSNINLNSDHDIALDGTWVEDVACMETVVSDNIDEDIVINSVSTPKNINFWDDEESVNYLNSDKEDDGLSDKPKSNDVVISNNPEILTLCETPQINVDKTFIFKGSQSSNMFLGLYDTESLEKILSESNSREGSPFRKTEYMIPSESPKSTPDDKENMNIILLESNTKENCFHAMDLINQKQSSKSYEKTQDVTVKCESSIDNVFSYNHRDDSIKYTTSSSPEVSSTTSEEKSSSLLLKITNYNCTKISQINNFNTNNKTISCKFTEKTDYAKSNIKLNSNRPLITKAAQKYIPPIKESIRDLKVKLSLPQHSLLKLKQIKSSKEEPKPKETNTPSRLPKKPKPKFEDVLKSIDEIQIKMHKEKTKKVKKSIPKVVIKKNEYGSHYASTSNKDKFNPDLTGRKWQPWVFIEKNNFIDKMAMRRKSKAIFSHRKNAYVLAEKFHKYKSASSTKFVISQPKLCGSSTGQLKYTIRLKHSY